MVLEFDDYRIITDDRQFIIQKKKKVKENNLTKETNIGKEYWTNHKYYSSFNSALKYLQTAVLLDNDDLQVIIDKLKDIERLIDKLTKELEIVH